MMKMILYSMIIMSSAMMSLNQPIMLGLLVLMQTIFVCLITRMITFSAWIPLSMFLVMVGGLMVIFTYMNSICSNVKFKFLNVKFILIYSIIPVYTIFSESFMFNYYDNTQLKDNYNLEFMKLFLPMNISSSMFSFLYLLTALMIMISLIQLTKGPLRKKY